MFQEAYNKVTVAQVVKQVSNSIQKDFFSKKLAP